VLAKGKLAYHGHAAEALNYFANHDFPAPANYNPADFIIDTVGGGNFDRTFDEGTEVMPSSYGSVNGGGVSELMANVSEYASPFWKQFVVLTERTFLNSLRNPFLLKLQYGMTIVVGLMLGYLYYHVPNDLQHGGMQNRMGAFFFIMTLLSFGAMTSIDVFFTERLLFIRERANGCYRTSSYFFAKAVSDLIPMRVIPALLLGGIVYYMIGFRPYYIHFLYFLVTLVLVSMTSAAMCFAISSIVPTVSVGNMVAILLQFFFLLFGGFLINFSNMSKYVQWIPRLSYVTYGFRILMVNEFDGLDVLINPDGYSPTLVPGRVILSQVGMTVDEFYIDFVVLAGILVLYMVLSYVFLRFFVKEKR